MSDYKVGMTTLFENRKRLNRLKQFSDYFEQYQQNSEFDFNDQVTDENEIAKSARKALNRMMTEVKNIVRLSGFELSIEYTDPLILGGRSRGIDLLENLFNLNAINTELVNKASDAIERAIGSYENDLNKSKFRTFTPWFWMWRFAIVIAGIPFRFLENFGINRETAELSWIGRSVKGILSLISFLAEVVTLAEFTARLLGHSIF